MVRVPPWLAVLACGVGFAAASPEPTASADYCRCGGWKYYAAGRSCVNVCPGNAEYGRRSYRRGRRIRHSQYDRQSFRYDRDVFDERSAERAIRERGRTATAAAAEQSWRLWHRPESVYGAPPTAPRNVRSLLAEERSEDLTGIFCVEGAVVLPKTPTPEARAFCSKTR